MSPLYFLPLLLLLQTSETNVVADLAVTLQTRDSDVGQAEYLASIRWTGNYPQNGVLVLGAEDTSDVVWVQKTESRIKGKKPGQREATEFWVSDRSAYPLDFALFSLTKEAYAKYEERCTRNRACYFLVDGPGVTRLSEFTEICTADMPRACD